MLTLHLCSAQPDWDMFHSKHPKAELHAAARAVSGAAVYVSDLPGAHDFALLRRVVLPDGSVLRARLPGRPTRDALFADVLRDRRSLLKVRRHAFVLQREGGRTAIAQGLAGGGASAGRECLRRHNPSSEIGVVSCS